MPQSLKSLCNMLQSIIHITHRVPRSDIGGNGWSHCHYPECIVFNQLRADQYHKVTTKTITLRMFTYLFMYYYLATFCLLLIKVLDTG